MSYKKAESNSFAEYQMGQGFGAAVTGNINTTEGVAKLAQKGMNALPAGLRLERVRRVPFSPFPLS